MFKGYCDTNIMIFRNGEFIQMPGVTYTATENTKDEVFRTLSKQVTAANGIDRMIYPVNVQILPLV